MITPHKVFELYSDDKRRLYTKSLDPGSIFFEEKVVHAGANEYREFEPRHSKLAATIAKGATNIGIRQGMIVLYLGASHGYTPSFISDMIGSEGLLFGLDFAPRVVRDLVFLAQKKKNIVPILADCNHPENYAHRICAADIVYQDVAQRNQAEIFLENCRLFLKKGGYGLLAVKARSINAKENSKKICEEVRKRVEKEMTVIDFRMLEPFEMDHAMIVVKK